MDINGEVALIKRLKDGDRNAFDSLYKLYSARLYYFCLGFSKSKTDSEEVIQSVFIKLWLNRSSITNCTSLSSLLFSIAKNDLINLYRKALNSPSYEEYVHYKDSISVSSEYDNLEYQDFLKKVKLSLNSLPARQKEIIILSKFENLSNKEISLRLSLSEQTVKNQLSLGLKELRKLLDYRDYIVLMLLLVN